MKDALDSSSLRAVLVAAVYLASSVRSVRSVRSQADQAVQEMRGGYVENCRNKRRETVVPYHAFGCLRVEGAEEQFKTEDEHQ